MTAMSESEIRVIFGKLDDISDRLARVEANQSNAKESLAALDGKVDALRTRGCIRGLEQERRIGVLEARPEKTLSAAGTVVAILAAVVSGIGAVVVWIVGAK